MTDFSAVKAVLIANRGEIACRIISSCKKYGLISIAVYSKEDAGSLHVSSADKAILLPGTGAQAYINIKAIVDIAADSKADVVIPGYGFLSENADFAHRLAEKNIKFAGPSSDSIHKFGLKHVARSLAIDANVPVVPGTELVETIEDAIAEGEKIGYPLMLKATAGGGGMGLKTCYTRKELTQFFGEVKSRGKSLFSDTGVFIEKYIKNSRHIEIQLFGNGLGDVITYGERECSIQRRHQKVVEESPSPYATFELRKKLSQCAISLASSIKYKSAGTVEFLVDDDTGNFYFLEMNTRLQVEHGVSELVYGVDLVYLMLLQAEYEFSGSGIPLKLLQTQSSSSLKEDILEPEGHSIEVRVYAENPAKDFAPSPGILHFVDLPENKNIRVDHWISTGAKVSPYFDPLLAKVISWGDTREDATRALVDYLKLIKIQGPPTNVEYLVDILSDENFKSGYTLTSFLESFDYKPNVIEFEEGGAYTTIQDLPGRVNMNGGIPQSGPVDSLSLQLANIIVGNKRTTEAFEINLLGPTIKFHSSSIIALVGAEFEFEVNGVSAPLFTEIFIEANSIVKIGSSKSKAASKAYLAVKGGLPGVAFYLGSKSCSPSLSLGGHQGRPIFAGDCLAISPIDKNGFEGYSLPEQSKPNYDQESWTIRMLRGPHDSQDIVSQKGLDELYGNPYNINLNSNRGATRLDGPSLKFSRKTGGDGGSHPSNILEYPYPMGGLSAVGSTMVLFGSDGATLSGFACVATTSSTDFWKIGQAAVEAQVKFKLITFNDASKLRRQREDFLQSLESRPSKVSSTPFIDELTEYDDRIDETILYSRQSTTELPIVEFRQAGERNIIVNFDLITFDFLNCGRQYVLDLKIKQKLGSKVAKVDCAPGALTVEFDPDEVDRDELLKELVKLENDIPPITELKVPSRTFSIPISFDHKALTHCIERYMKTQRPEAPYLPSNTEFVMKANLLNSLESFKSTIVNHSQIVVGVSFLCALPLLVHTDPRLRLLCPKYNPARTFTPAGAIGTGSVSQAIYSVDSPGGYMLWGMTLPNAFWDTFCRLPGLEERPWFLNIFDQVKFYEVDEHQLNELNNRLLIGDFKLEWEQSEFDFQEYSNFLASIKEETDHLKTLKLEAIDELSKEEERSLARWKDDIEASKVTKNKSSELVDTSSAIKLTAHMTANVYRINYQNGEKFNKDDVVVILEAMKMEIPIRVKDAQLLQYEIIEIAIEEGDIVKPGDVLAFVKAVE